MPTVALSHPWIRGAAARRVPVIPSVTFVRGAGNEPTQIVATLRDISELRSLEKSVEESSPPH